MESGLHKVGDGLKLIQQSVRLVITYPVLLVYGVCSSIIAYAIKFAFESSPYSIVSNLSMLMDAQASSEQKMQFWTTHSYFQLAQFSLLTFIGIFFLACLAHHAMHKLKKESHGCKETLRDILYKLPKLFVWFAFIFVVYHYPFRMVWQLFWAHYPLPAWVVVYCMIMILLVYVTSLVLPILATEPIGVIAAFKRSYQLVSRYLMVFIGIFLLFNMLILVCKYVVITMPPSKFFMYGYGKFFMYGYDALLIFVRHLEILTYTIFYYDYYAKNTLFVA